MVGSSQPGVVYEVKVLRQGKELLLGVELGQLGEPFLQKPVTRARERSKCG